MIRAIISIVLVIIALYFVITSTQRYFVAQEEVMQAEKDLGIAKQEHAEARIGLDKPLLNTGIVLII
jgi:hypothetical protein